MGEEEGDANEGITTIMGSGIDHTTVSFAANDGVGLLHFGHNIHFAHSGSVVLLTILAGDITQGTSGRQVAYGVARSVLENVVSHSDEGVFLTIHLSVFADESKAIHVWVNDETDIVASLCHQPHNVGEVLLQRFRVVLEVACGFCIERGDVFNPEGLEEFGQDDAAHGIDAVKCNMEILLLDGWHINEVETQHHVNVLLVVGVVLNVFAKTVNISIVEVFCLSNLQHLVAFGGIEKFAFLVEELESVPMTGVVASCDDDAATGTFHRHGYLSGGCGGKPDVDHLARDAGITTYYNLVAFHFCGATNQSGVCTCEFYNVEGIQALTGTSANCATDAGNRFNQTHINICDLSNDE